MRENDVFGKIVDATMGGYGFCRNFAGDGRGHPDDSEEVYDMDLATEIRFRKTSDGYEARFFNGRQEIALFQYDHQMRLVVCGYYGINVVASLGDADGTSAEEKILGRPLWKL